LNTTIIGIDCAAQPKDIGLALGQFDGQTAEITQAIAGFKTRNDFLDTISAWMQGSRRTLLALDAPMGWPVALGRVLTKHTAGAPTDAEANAMFRRCTDRVVRDEVGKQSLDVGADRIARTAHAALGLLNTLRRKTGLGIPLAWEPTTDSGVYAIEVYPAATLRAHGLPDIGYKKKDSNAVRRSILDQVAGKGIRLSRNQRGTCENCDDALDAVVCVLAGVDFLRGNAICPTDMQEAMKEGWIWVHKPREPSG
jgi:predicted RNase H-like nuclease